MLYRFDLSGLTRIALAIGIALALAACAPAAAPAPEAAPDQAADEHEGEEGDHAEAEAMAIPALTALDLDGRPVSVVASNSIVADVVGQVGGDRIDLEAVIPLGQDPHTYEPTPQDIARLEGADVIFVTGLNFEEGLVAPLEAQEGKVPVVPVSAGVEVREGEEHEHEGEEHKDEGEEHKDEDDHALDPHTYTTPVNVMVWADNIAQVLSALDPANAATYEANAAAYKAELEALDSYIQEQVAIIPEAERRLVLDHDSMGYFADRYGFETIGTIIPSLSSDAEPTAAELGDLIETMRKEDVNVIFVGEDVGPRVADVVAEELGEDVQVVLLYHASLGEPGSETDTYVKMMRHNVETIVEALAG